MPQINLRPTQFNTRFTTWVYKQVNWCPYCHPTGFVRNLKISFVTHACITATFEEVINHFSAGRFLEAAVYWLAQEQSLHKLSFFGKGLRLFAKHDILETNCHVAQDVIKVFDELYLIFLETSSVHFCWKKWRVVFQKHYNPLAEWGSFACSV